ncbi:hypothetical protein AK812_SmicGene31031 [Symbiodinium microadriaticum]|uniref:Reverse transcriptase Ty1/copia-type domain-containing protein n=1 Tax=Symbiodinium microadriaticum TaxID=2951 RepID=A0A1Q9CXT1_SYMMI|nr:hypothetical protein AK812_SmicGene31031 [Symbiodinium microadriaticum]
MVAELKAPRNLGEKTCPEAETDTFVFPAKRSGEATGQGPSNFAEKQQSTEPLAPGDLQEVEDLLRDDFDDEAAEAIPPRDDLSVQGQTMSSSEVEEVQGMASDLEVTVAVNQDEKKLLLMKTLENPHIWYHTEFPHEEEAAGMTKEMKSMRDFGVFDEVDIDKVRVKLWNQLSPRSYTQQVEDKDETFASTPSFTTLPLLLTLAIAMGWHISMGDMSTAFLHALVNEDFYLRIFIRKDALCEMVEAS